MPLSKTHAPEVRPGVQPGGLFWPPPPKAIESFPIITSLTPDSDRVAGSVSVTITGSRFVTGATVKFAGVLATSIVVVNPTTITCNTPAVPEGIVDVVVTNPNAEQSTLVAGFTFIAGHIISLSNTRGLTTGGTNVTIKGTNFVAGSTVKFDGVVATGYIFIDAQTIFCVTPAHGNGVIDVTITEPSTAVVTGKKLFTFTSAVFNSDIRRAPSITIQQTLNSGPNRATFKIGQTGVPPAGGEKVIFTDLTNLLFTGEVTNVRQLIEDSKENWAWEVTALDERFKFNRRRPFGTWDNVSISDIARELITKNAPGFNADFVQARLPKVSLVLNGDDDMNTVFSKLAGSMSEGHWYIDNRSVHMFQLNSALGTSESPVSALVMPSIAAMTAAVSTTSTLGYNFVPGYYYFMSLNGYGVPPAGDPNAKVYDALSGTGVTVMANRANTSGVFLNYGQGGVPTLPPLSGQDDNHPRWILLSRQAANRNLSGDISNGVYCDSGRLFGRGWIGVDVDGNIFANGAWPAAGANALYFASSDIWNALETASGTPAQPVQVYFESALSQISNIVYLEKYLPALSNIPTGAVLGGRTCTLRKIFAVRLGDGAGAGGTTIQGYATINDNTTTALTTGPSATFAVPPHQNVNPPVGPLQAPTIVDSGVAVDPLVFLGRIAHPGWWAFKVTGVYRDGTESRSSLASGPMNLTGLNQAAAINLPTFPTINGVDCVFRRIYGSVFYRTSDPTAAGVPDFDVSDTQCVAVIPDNIAVTLQFPFGTGITGGEHAPNNIPPGEEDLPGPNLEVLTQPEDLTVSSTYLLLDPPITTESDTTQLKNRIIVKGKGSILASDAKVGDTSIKLADVSTFSAAGGTFITSSRIVAYSGTDGTTVPPKLLLGSPLTVPILQADWKFGGGTPILPIVIVDDLASQKFYGQLELDASGNPTDGIHEFTITDNTLTNVQQLYARGLTELKLFSRPIVTLRYATRDPLTKAGKVIHVNLDKPPIYGDFVIQEVTIDQMHDESDSLAPRYTVTADSAARFNMNDLLLKLSESVGEKAQGSSAGLISTSVSSASNIILASIAAAPGALKFVEIAAQPVNAWLYGRFTNPLTLVAGVAGVTHIPVWCGIYSSVTGTGGNYVNGACNWEIEWVAQFGTLPQIALASTLGLDTAVTSPAINRAFLSGIFNFATNNVANVIFTGIGKPLLLQSSTDISGGTNGVAGLTLVYFDTSNNLY